MDNIHQLNLLPAQSSINLIASYSTEFECDNFNYHQLLEKMQVTILGNSFMKNIDNANWMNHRGGDYLNNPKLFSNAPLTYLCAFLSEIFKQSDIRHIEKNICPNILKAALIRLNEFK